MIDYKNLIDIVYIEHPSNENYREEYIESFKGEFAPRSVIGIDGDLGYGRKLCVSTSNKKYIMLNDADDVYMPEVIKEAIAFLERDEDLKYCAVSAREGYTGVGVRTSSLSPECSEFAITPEMLEDSLFFLHNFVVYRTDLLKESIKDFQTTEHNFDYAFKKNYLSGDRLAWYLGRVGCLFRIRNDGKNWLSTGKNK